MGLKISVSENKRIFGIISATIILSSLVGIPLVSDSFAMKAKGKAGWKYGSATSGIVCGDRLCSEIPNVEPGYVSNMKLQSQDIRQTVNCTDGEILIRGTHCVAYEVSETFVSNAYVDEELSSLIIEVDPYNGGTLVIDLSPQIISGMFMILIDDQEWRDSHIEGNKVTVNFPWGTEKIEIIDEKVQS